MGQLNWVARHTRPDIVFDVMELSTALNKPCIRDYAQLVKTVKKLKYSDVGVIFPNLDELQNRYLLVMADAGYANLCDSVSSAAGYEFSWLEMVLNAFLCVGKLTKYKEKSIVHWQLRLWHCEKP